MVKTTFILNIKYYSIYEHIIDGINRRKKGPITTLIFNRPEIRNALTKNMKDSLSKVLHRIAQDDTVKVVVLTGKGQHFMAGGDLNTMQETLNLPKEEIKDYFLKRIYDLNPIITCLQQMPKPVIASVSAQLLGLELVWR